MTRRHATRFDPDLLRSLNDAALNRRWRRRALRALGRATHRGVRATTRGGWRHRHRLAPLYTAATCWTTGAALHHVDQGDLTILALGATGAPALYWWLGGPMPHLGPWDPTQPRRSRAETAWWAAAYATAIGLTTAQAAWRLGAPMPGLWALATATYQTAWAWRQGTPTKAAETIGADERTNTWKTIKRTTGTTLTNITDLAEPVRWVGDVDLSESESLVEHIRAAIPHIAKAYRKPAANVMVDLPPNGVELTARVTVVRDNPCHQAIEYAERHATHVNGGVPFHVYPDGTIGHLRLWVPRSGTTHSLFSGDSRSGKSAGMETALVQATKTGLVWPMVADAQGGTSIPAWVGEDGVAPSRALDPEQILNQLQALQAAMRARNKLLQTRRWTDEDGDTQTGCGFYDPEILPDLPLILFAFDEAPFAVKDPDYGDEIITIVERLVKMAAKVGIILWLATQYPGIEELGNKMAIRQNLIAGNAICYRNSAKGSGDMLLQSHMPAPHNIPLETPTGDHTKGTATVQSAAARSSRPTYSRTLWVRRQTLWAQEAISHIPNLDEATGNAMAPHLDLTSHPTTTPTPTPEPTPARERITIQPKIRPNGALAKILDLLGDNTAGLHTGVIATRLDMPKPTVSGTMTRAKAKGLVHDPRPGIWAAGPKRDTNTDTDLAHATA